MMDLFEALLPSGVVKVPEGFYVYALELQGYGTCYIGKGVGLRAWEHPDNLHKIISARLKGKISKHENAVYTSIIKVMLKRQCKLRVKVLAQGLSEKAAFLLEKQLIADHGRLITNNGKLFNLADGGAGVGGDYLAARAKYGKGENTFKQTHGLRPGKLERQHAKSAFGMFGGKLH